MCRSLGQATPCMTAFAAGQAAAYKMFEVIKRTPQIDTSDLIKGKMLDNLRGEIKLKNIDFAYPARLDVPIFSNFNLTISAGTTVALVGESGSGKSTVVSLIQRFYDPTGGAVLVDGIDIKTLQLKWLRQQIGLVSQEPVLFSTSIRDNIAYGKDGATDAEIQAAAVRANAANFINRMPEVRSQTYHIWFSSFSSCNYKQKKFQNCRSTFTVGKWCVQDVCRLMRHK
jgi:ATP-binding cassette subfamily B (MDR/TAP) protein 1